MLSCYIEHAQNKPVSIENGWYVPWPGPSPTLATPNKPLQHSENTPWKRLLKGTWTFFSSSVVFWKIHLGHDVKYFTHSLFFQLSLSAESCVHLWAPISHSLKCTAVVAGLRYKRGRVTHRILWGFFSSVNTHAFIMSFSKATNHWNDSLHFCFIKNYSLPLVQVSKVGGYDTMTFYDCMFSSRQSPGQRTEITTA